MIAQFNDKTGEVTVIIAGQPVPNTPEAILAATRAQMVCTPRQARLAMIQTSYPDFPSLLSAVEGAIYAGDEATRIAWEYATQWRRDDPLINGIGAALGLTDTEIDALFVRAMAI